MRSINQINQLPFGMRIAPWSVAVHNTHENPGVTENYLFERVTRDMTVDDLWVTCTPGMCVLLSERCVARARNILL